jgi:hypothetical protein
VLKLKPQFENEPTSSIIYHRDCQLVSASLTSHSDCLDLAPTTMNEDAKSRVAIYTSTVTEFKTDRIYNIPLTVRGYADRERKV